MTSPSHEPADTLQPLHALVAIARLVREETPIEELLDRMARLVADALGFGGVVINLYRPQDDRFEVTSVVSEHDEARDVLLGETTTASTWDDLLHPRFEQHGTFFVPAGSFDWDSFEATAWQPPLRVVPQAPTQQHWNQHDELFAPMRGASGDLLGVLSVGDPIDGLRPTLERLEVLASVASHAGLVIEQRQIQERASEHSTALARLFTVASCLNETLDPVPTLLMVRDGVRDALGFADVTLALRDDSPLAAAATSEIDALTISPATLHALLDAGEERAGTYLLTIDQARLLWPGPTPAPTPGAGPRAWGGHLLLVPLHDESGEPAGLLAVAAPRDRLLPDDGRLQTLTMFAAQAAATLHSAAGRALLEERERAEHLASHDLVTGLANRAGFLSALSESLEAGEHPAVLVLDLDDFKIVNDGLGHAAGDELLQAVAGRLEVTCESELVCRLGADEFAVLVTDPADADLTASRVHDALRLPVALEAGEHLVGARIGIATAAEGVTPIELLGHADIAMYQAKQATTHTAVYDAETDQAAAQLELVTALREAPARGELELHFQPIVLAGRGTPVALEALVRWRRDGVLVPPMEFIPLAESTGAIENIGRWVIQEAAAQSRRWQDAGHPVPPIAVNVSPRQLRGGDLAAVVGEALRRHSLTPDALSIELTESALLPDLRADAQLEQLRELGVRRAIDDFGADYSSLHRLQDLPVDVLKIDRAFLRNVPESPRALGLLRAIIGLAASLDLAVVVEGVETEEQRALLAELDPRLWLQGFLFSRPLPAAELVDWLAPRLARAA